MALDIDLISAQLQAASDPDTARKRMKQVRPLRGVRGVPVGEVARVAAAAWRSGPTPDDLGALDRLFSEAWEDGMVAIGLAAALVPEDAHGVLDRVEAWLDRVDDLDSADALGWLAWGPALRAAGEPVAEVLLDARGAEVHPVRRRAAVVAGFAFLPMPIEGPAAAPLRERLASRGAALVLVPAGSILEPLVRGFVRDEDPHVRKAVGRLLREWGSVEPERVEALWRSIPGGVARTLRDEAERGIQKGRRPARPTRAPEG